MSLSHCSTTIKEVNLKTNAQRSEVDLRLLSHKQLGVHALTIFRAAATQKGIAPLFPEGLVSRQHDFTLVLHSAPRRIQRMILKIGSDR